MIQKKAWNNSDDSKTPGILDIEHKLTHRLGFMGYIFFSLSLASLAFAIFVHLTPQEPPPPVIIDETSILADIEAIAGADLFSDMHPLEIYPHEVFNFYIVSLIFASIGTSLFYYSSKKKKMLQEDL